MTNQERDEKLKCIILTVHHTMFLAVETGGKKGNKQWKKAISDAISQINQLFSEGKECPECKGSGRIIVKDGTMLLGIKDCDKCNGKGKDKEVEEAIKIVKSWSPLWDNERSKRYEQALQILIDAVERKI